MLSSISLPYTRTALITTGGAVYAVTLMLNVITLLTPPQLALTLSVRSNGDAQVEWVLPDGMLWDKGGVRPGDVVIALDGRTPTSQDAGRWSGDSVVVRTATGDVKSFDTGWLQYVRGTWPLLVLSPWFFVLGTLVYARARRPAVGRATYAFFASAAFALAMAPGAVEEHVALVVTEWAAVTLFPACFLLFFLEFPVSRGSTRLRVLLLTPPVLVGGLRPVTLVWPSLLELVSLLRLAVLLLYLLAGIGLPAYSLFTSRDRDSRRGLLILCAGTAMSILPFLALYVAPTLLGRVSFLPPQQAILPLALMPISFAYAILRHDVFRVPLLQRWLVQGLLWVGLLVPFVGVVYVLHRLLDVLPETSYVLVIEAVLVLLAGVLVVQLRYPLRRLLDRLIFKDSYDYRTSLQGLAADLSVAADLDTLGMSLPGTLRRLMNLDFAVLLVHDRGRLSARGAVGPYQPEMLSPLADAARDVVDGPAIKPLAFADMTVLIVPLRTHGAIVGYLCLGPKTSGEPFRAQDVDLLATLSGQVGAVVENTQLLEELRTKVAALDALNVRMQGAQEEERARLAADIHDEPLQTALHLQRQLAAKGGSESEVYVTLSQVLIDQLRLVCTSVRPPVLDDLGLPAALDVLAAERGGRAGVPVVLEVDEALAGIALDPAAELTLYRVAQEAINNSVRHAHPSSIQIALQRRSRGVRLTIKDDGTGFAVPNSLSSLAARGHLGLAGMRKRVQGLGGRLGVASQPGAGTTVCVDLPVDKVAS